MADAANRLGLFDGLWISTRTAEPDPDGPRFGAGCEVGNSNHRIVLEMYHDPSAALRFGTDNFGDHDFGQYTGGNPPGGGLQWVDWTAFCFGAVVNRGTERPDIDVPTDELIFSINDANGDLFDWKPPGSLSAPNLNTPVRVGFTEPDGTYGAVFYGRLERADDIHEGQPRAIECTAYGTRADLASTILLPSLGNNEPVDTRIQNQLDAIGWQNGYDPSWPQAELGDVDLEPDLVIGEIATAYRIIQQAANSAGYKVSPNKVGQFRVVPIVHQGVWPTPKYVISDCESDQYQDVAAIANEIRFVSDSSQILNVVQIVNNLYPNGSVERIDANSVATWGRRTRGYGFPITVANNQQSGSYVEDLADNILAATANIIDRVEAITFNTLSDPRWWRVLLDLDLNDAILVRRIGLPNVIEFTATIVGVNWTLGTDGFLEGTITLSTLDQTL